MYRASRSSAISNSERQAAPRRTTTARSAIMLIAVIAGVLVHAQAPAYACSCGQDGPAEKIEQHDGSFIGELVEVGRAADADGANQAQALRYRFEISRWVKGDLGSSLIDIMTPPQGSTCGFSLRVDQEAAIFFRVEGGTPSGGLCSTLETEVMLAYLTPGPASSRPAAFVAGAAGGRPGIWLLDADGAIVASASADQGADSALWRHALCADGRSLLEARASGIAVRDLATMDIRERLDTSPDLEAMSCAYGDRMMGVERSPSGVSIVAMDLRTGEVLATSTSRRVQLAADGLLSLREGNTGVAWGQLRYTAFSDGVERTIHDVGERKDGEQRGIDGFAVSPDGRRVALATPLFGRGEEPRTDMFVYDLATGDLLASASIDSELYITGWPADQRIAVSNGQGESGVIDATTLETIAVVGENWSTVVLAEGERFVVVDGPRVQVMDGRAPTITTVLPAQHPQVTALPAPLDIVGSAATTADRFDLPLPGVSRADVDPSFLAAPTLDPLAVETNPDDARSWAGWISGFAGAIAVLALSATAVLAIRRLRPR